MISLSGARLTYRMMLSDPYWRILTQTFGSLIININRFIRVHYYTSGQFNFCICMYDICVSAALFVFPPSHPYDSSIFSQPEGPSIWRWSSSRLNRFFLPPLFAQGPGSRSLWSPETQFWLQQNLHKWSQIELRWAKRVQMFIKNTLYLYGILTSSRHVCMSSLLNEYKVLPHISNSVLAQTFNYVRNQSQ